MKNLLTLLLFVAINCKAQNTEGLNLLTANDFRDYQKECYNDSSFVNVQIKQSGWCNETINGMTTLLHCPAVYEQKWVHRIPTFEGFLIFINKRYGK